MILLSIFLFVFCVYALSLLIGGSVMDNAADVTLFYPWEKVLDMMKGGDLDEAELELALYMCKLYKTATTKYLAESTLRARFIPFYAFYIAKKLRKGVYFEQYV